MKHRVAIFGKNTIAVKVLQVLEQHNDCEICLVVPNNNDNGKNDWQLSLKFYANQKNYNVKQFQKIKNPDTISYLKDLRLDFIFSVQYDQIIDQSVIDTAKFGAINLHFAPLPKYRGVSPIAWALINGEEEFGVTLHYMDPGVDTGDIISQIKFNISKIKNARELYDLCTIKGELLFSETIDSILKLNNQRIPQDNSKALYYPKDSINFKENKINFKKDTRSLVNWIKAFIFEPFQYPYFEYEGNNYYVIDVSPDYHKNNFEAPGTVVLREGNAFKVATHDSYINLITKDF